jgi:hypothetical protein
MEEISSTKKTGKKVVIAENCILWFLQTETAVRAIKSEYQIKEVFDHQCEDATALFACSMNVV